MHRGGAIAKVLKKHAYNVTGIDIIDHGYPGTKVIDFLEYTEKFEGDIITNPPYYIQLDFVKQCLRVGNKVALLLKLQFLETIQRYEHILKNNPPSRVYVFVKRVHCNKNDIVENKSSAICYCWYIWEGVTDETYIYWIPNHNKD